MIDEEFELELFEVYCDECGTQLPSKDIIKAVAHCPECNNSTWNFTATYLKSVKNKKKSFAGEMTASAIGIGWEVYDETRKSYTYENVDGRELLKMAPREHTLLRAADKYLLGTEFADADEKAVKAFIEKRLREEYIARTIAEGGIYCKQCYTRSMPDNNELWSSHGCCSLMCLSLYNPELAAEVKIEFDKRFETTEKSKPQKLDKISVTCPLNHNFEVLIMYSGGIRKCPVCGEKVNIPDISTD